MGWTDLFKPRATKQSPDPKLRWFGKLPTYPDYYSSTADEAWAVEFNDWILRGYERFIGRLKAVRSETAADSPKTNRRLESSGCFIRIPESGMTVLASIQDYGGDMRGRPFPLCLYVGVPTAQWPGPGSARLLPALRVVRDLTALRHDVARFFNAPGRFESIFEGREIDLSGIDDQTVDDSWVAAASAVSLGDWFGQTRSGRDGAELGSWTGAIGQSGRNIAALDSDDFEAALSFPLSTGLAWDVQAAGWIRWLESYMDLSRKYLSLMITGDADTGPGRLAVLARKAIGEEDFLLLTPVWHTSAYADDLTGSGEVGATGSADGARPGNVPEPRASASWGDFVASGAPVS
ncbi:MAG TPA: hypothetical protein VM243_07810 [Phycisphaerae bacterium]|nr:hypothetical protein [Phycisphaerae bacterium]